MKGSFCLFLFCCCILSATTFAQTIGNVQVKFEEGGIAVYYDVTDTDPSKQYDFFLYGSHDNFKNPLKEVSGDIGQKVTPGPGKKARWDARKEFGNFKGDINLKIKGSIHTPLLSFEGITENQKIKKLKPLNITWTSSSKSERLTFEILEPSGKKAFAREIENSGHYTWTVPKTFKTGRGYRVKMSAANNPLVYEVSPAFYVSNKTPFILKVAPVVIAGGTYLFLSGSSGKNPKGSGSEQNGIPDPPSNP